MRITTLSAFTAAAALLLGLAGCTDTDTPNVAGDVSLRPYAAEPLEAPIPANSVYFFQDSGFRGDVTRVENVSAQPALTPIALAHGSNKITGLRWRLPPGVAVVLYEDAEGRGDQVVIWGDGQMSSLAPWKFNDQVSRWSWAYLGGVENASAQVRAGLSERPLYANPTGDIPMGVVQAFKDRGFMDTLTTLGPVRQSAMGVRHRLGGAADSVSSLRWNLPPGVLVVLYEDAGGYGRQLALWGKGQYETVSEWDFNDKASRWAWYDISSGRIASAPDHAWTR
jgi:hypothetical protein